jgi:CubicO group peptidase (beta-lactamase class C family)
MGNFTQMAAVALVICSSTTVADDSSIVSGEAGRAIDWQVQRATGGGFWGAIAVASGGKMILAKGYGYADYAQRPNTPRSLFEIASVSKPFTAAGVLKLQMQGKLAVTDSISKYFDAVPQDKVAITVHQLLTHTSGIAPRVGLPYSSTATRDEFIDLVMRQPLASNPGQEYAYCNAG